MATGDIKQSFGASAAFTITLASLASNATFVIGRESTAVDVAGLNCDDVLVAGKITVGTTPTINTVIQVWAYGSLNDTPDYPDVIDGTDSDETWTTVAIRDAGARLIATMLVDATTSDRTYYFSSRGLAGYFGGVLPNKIGLYVSHNTAVNLNATGGNHVIKYTPVYHNVAA